MQESVAHVPHPALRPYVPGMVGYRYDGVPPAVHRGLPSPYLTLVITLDEPLEVVASASGVGRYAALLGGLDLSPALIVRPPRQSGIQLMLSPLGARALLGLPAAALAAVHVELGDVLRPAAQELTDRLRTVGPWPARFAVLERFLGRLLRDEATAGPEVREAWRLTTSSGGQIRVEDLARHVGWSPRHLTVRFRAETGLAPKEAARVVRFDRARRQLALRAVSGSPLDLAGLAADRGWYDQAHLTRDWRAFSGLAPTRWLAEEIGFVQDGAMAAAAASLS